MKLNELLYELEKLHIIIKVGDEWIITETYKNVGEKTYFIDAKGRKDAAKRLDIKTLLTQEIESGWPQTVVESHGKYKVTALMDACEIPVISRKRYRLRGVTDELIKAVTKLVLIEDIRPALFIECIKRYYVSTEMPKSFKNLMLSDDAFDIYYEYAERNPNLGIHEMNKLIDPYDDYDKPDNVTWS
jgi:hypothetical protein